MIGLPEKPPEPQTYNHPSLDEACDTTTQLWPGRLSPQPKKLPPTSGPSPSSPDIILTAPTGAELGNLLLELISWMAEGVIDLTGEKPDFTPPSNTSFLLPDGIEMPTNLHILGGSATTYSV